MAVKAIEEEYWSVQYRTDVAGHREPTWWPVDGEGRYGREKWATETMKDPDGPFRHRRELRVIRVVRRVEYGEAWKRDGEWDS